MFLQLISIAFCIYSAGAQIAEGVPCETPDGDYGTCININNCGQLLQLLLNESNKPQVRTFLRSSACGYVGRTPMVCCPPVQKAKNDGLVNGANNSKDANQPLIKLPKVPDCGTSNISNSRIVNGIPAKLGEFPWIVALGYKNNKNPDQPKWLCGGTLITNRHILTAAHCVHNRNDLYLARLGDLDLFSDDDGAKPITIPLKKAKLHEDYSPSTFTSDIAILTLERSTDNSSVWPICLPAEEPYRSKNFKGFTLFVAGWGSQVFKGPTSSTLQEAMLPVQDNQQCKQAYRNKSIIDDRVLCVGYLQGGTDACQGDSGGPLMYAVTNASINRFFLVGVVSYGFRCAEAGYPGVYTKVTSFLDWIERNLD